MYIQELPTDIIVTMETSVVPTQSYEKCDLVQTLNTLRNPSLQIFASRKASLVFNKNAFMKRSYETNNIFCS